MGRMIGPPQVGSATMHTEPRTFATEPVLGYAAEGFWWGALVSEDMYRGLIRDIEATKGRQSTHEAECALRYSRIEENTGTMKTDIARALAALETLAKRGEHAAWSANWKAWIIAAGIGALLLSWGVWSAAQLYQLEPLRVKAEAKK